MSSLPQVVARWDAFLANIYERFSSVLSEAQQGCAQLLVDNDYDTHAFGLAWSAMELRAKQLDTKLSDTWEDKVSPMFDDLDLQAAVQDRERAKGDALSDRMEIELEGMRVRIFADAARAVWKRAITEAPPHLSCSQCGAPMPVPPTLAAANVTCSACSGVVTYEPGARLRSIEHFCVHPLCEEAAWPQWLARHVANKAINDARDESLALLKAYEHAQIEYWRAYLSTQANLLPPRAAAFDADLRGKMQYWYELVDRSGPWIAGGRPRAIA